MGTFKVNTFVRFGGQVVFDIARLLIAFAFTVWLMLKPEQKWSEEAVTNIVDVSPSPLFGALPHLSKACLCRGAENR